MAIYKKVSEPRSTDINNNNAQQTTVQGTLPLVIVLGGAVEGRQAEVQRAAPGAGPGARVQGHLAAVAVAAAARVGRGAHAVPPRALAVLVCRQRHLDVHVHDDVQRDREPCTHTTQSNQSQVTAAAAELQRDTLIHHFKRQKKRKKIIKNRQERRGNLMGAWGKKKRNA